MKKKEFLLKLKDNLKQNKIDDVNYILDYYEDLIDGKIESGQSEEEALLSLGDVKKVTQELLSEFGAINLNNDQEITEIKAHEKIKKPSVGQKIESKRRGNCREFACDVENGFELKTRFVERKVIFNTHDENQLTVQAGNKFLSKIMVYNDKNTVTIYENSNTLWHIIIQVLLFSVFYGIYYLVCLDLINSSGWWHFLVAGLAAFTQMVIFYTINFLYSRNGNVVSVCLPVNMQAKFMQLNILEGKLEINKIYAYDVNVKVISGKVTLNNVPINNLSIKISSGYCLVSSDQNKQLNLAFINVSSGGCSVNNLEAAKFDGKISSGSLKLNQVKTNNFNFKVSSGGISGNDLTVKNDLIMKVSSGGIKINKVSFHNAHLKVSSGSIKLKNIAGSANDYLINSKVTSGRVLINNTKVSTYGYKLVNEMPSQSINTLVSSGSVNLTFYNDQYNTQ